MMYFLYGSQIPDGFVFCTDWEKAQQYAPLPYPGKNVRRLQDRTTYDQLVKIAGISLDKEALMNLYGKLADFRCKNGIYTPAHDCDKYGKYIYLENNSLDSSASPVPEKKAAEPVREIPVFEEKAMNLDRTVPVNRYAMSLANTEAVVPSFAVQLCLPQIVNFYIDGSCLNDVYGGFAAIALDGGRPLAFLSGSAKVESSTEAEWRAVHLALKSFMTEHHQIFIHTDCMDVVRVMNGAQQVGRRPDSFIHILQEIHALAQNHDITVSYVRGHNGNEWNVVADALARQRATELSQACLVAKPAVKIKKKQQEKKPEFMQQCLNFPDAEAV